MRRGVLLVGIWVAGAVIAVSLAFAAVARVANGVAPNDVSHLSQTDIDDELTGTTPPSRPAGGPTSSATSVSKPTSTVTTTSRPTPSTVSTITPTTGGPGPTTMSPTSPATSKSTPATDTTVSQPPPVTPHNTVTTSQGGTLYTRCSAPEKIVYVAAVPKTGYERTVDIEDPNGIKQVFVNSNHQSKIEAECSNGVVHAEVEEEAEDE